MLRGVPPPVLVGAACALVAAGSLRGARSVDTLSSRARGSLVAVVAGGAGDERPVNRRSLSNDIPWHVTCVIVGGHPKYGIVRVALWGTP